MKTLVLKQSEVQAKWWVVDAAEQGLGRMANKISMILMGKHRPDYTPHVACGDFVVVINAEKVALTGNKWRDKQYDRYSGYPSGRTVLTAEELRERRPEAIIELAVRRMLPKNKLARRMFQQLKVYAGPEHPHQAQQPQVLKFD